MGAYDTGLYSSCLCEELKGEYTPVFYYYGIEKGIEEIGKYVSENYTDYDEREKHCIFMYSLADYMWKKGILTDKIRNTVLDMIDSGYAMEIWEGTKYLGQRKKTLEKLREKLISPMPEKKKIKPNTYLEPIFENGDIIAIKLLTADKPYTRNWVKEMSDDDFHALDGKYVIIQKMREHISWRSIIAPGVRDIWPEFRLFDGVFDDIPDLDTIKNLKDAFFESISSAIFTCEGSMSYFKKRKYVVIGNDKSCLERYADVRGDNLVAFGINKEWENPDSILLAAMGNIPCAEKYTGDAKELKYILYHSEENFGNPHKLPFPEDKRTREREDAAVEKKLGETLSNGGIFYVFKYYFHPKKIKYVGTVSVTNGRLDDLCFKKENRHYGFAEQLIKKVIEDSDIPVYMEIPDDISPYQAKYRDVLMHICEKLGMERNEENGVIKYTALK